MEGGGWRVGGGGWSGGLIVGSGGWRVVTAGALALF